MFLENTLLTSFSVQSQTSGTEEVPEPWVSALLLGLWVHPSLLGCRREGVLTAAFSAGVRGLVGIGQRRLKKSWVERNGLLASD